jgi:hypothetical protein
VNAPVLEPRYVLYGPSPSPGNNRLANWSVKALARAVDEVRQMCPEESAKSSRRTLDGKGQALRIRATGSEPNLPEASPKAFDRVLSKREARTKAPGVHIVVVPRRLRVLQVGAKALQPLLARKAQNEREVDSLCRVGEPQPPFADGGGAARPIAGAAR